MKRTAITLILILTLLMLMAAGAQFANISSANFFPEPGPDLPRIYIRNDGSVEPATAPIERTGNLYKLTDNVVLYTIEIQRDNVVLDGAGHTIQGNASRIKGYDDGNNGVIVAERKNVNITRLNFEQDDTGVRISSSSHINVVDNSFFNGTERGVVVQDSTFVLIEANDFADIWSDYPSVRCSGSENTIRNNIITGSARGIKIAGSSNVMSDNRIESIFPIILDCANSNTIARNNITGPATSSLPDQNYKGTEGIALFTQCSNNIISGNNLTGFSGQAIRIVFDGSNNTIYGNYMANNQFAIALQEGAVNNTFYGNTFTADSCKIAIHDAYGNLWDNGTIGNYWGDYNGTDGNGDGIGDTPCTVIGFKWDNDIDGFVSFVSGQDNYPLMAPYDVEHDAVVLPQAEPFLAVLVAAASVAAVVVVGAGLLIYFKKRNK